MTSRAFLSLSLGVCSDAAKAIKAAAVTRRRTTTVNGAKYAAQVVAGGRFKNMPNLLDLITPTSMLVPRANLAKQLQLKKVCFEMPIVAPCSSDGSPAQLSVSAPLLLCSTPLLL